MFSTESISPSVGESVYSFAESVEGLADLRLVRAVDETVDALLAETKFYRSHAVTGRTIIARIDGLSVSTDAFLDDEGTLEAMLDVIIDRCESTLTTLTAKKGHIDGDGRLSSSHCDMLHSAYDEALVTLARLIEVTKDMRAAIIRHDLAAERRDGKVYTDVSEMMADILQQ